MTNRKPRVKRITNTDKNVRVSPEDPAVIQAVGTVTDPVIIIADHT